MASLGDVLKMPSVGLRRESIPKLPTGVTEMLGWPIALAKWQVRTAYRNIFELPVIITSVMVIYNKLVVDDREGWWTVGDGLMVIILSVVLTNLRVNYGGGA